MDLVLVVSGVRLYDVRLRYVGLTSPTVLDNLHLKYIKDMIHFAE